MTGVNSLYKGTVTNDNDPEGRRRVQVRVLGMMDGIPDAYLPWAKPQAMSPGSDILPSKGDKVWVRFAEGDINDAYYMGGVVEDKDDLPASAKKGRYILFQSKRNGITITVDENSQDIEIKTKDYNTTLGALIDAFLNHKHNIPAIPGPAGAPSGGVTSIPTGGTGVGILGTLVADLTAYTSADFNTGTL